MPPRDGAPDDLPLSLSAALDRVRDQFYVFDAEPRLRFWNERVGEVTGHDERTLAGASLSTLFDADTDLAAVVAAAGEDGTVESATATVDCGDGTRLELELAVEAIRTDGDVVGYTVVAWPAEAAGAYHSAIARHREQIDRLQRINAVVRDTLTVAIRVDRQEELARQVCERLAAEDSYRYVWFATPTHATGSFVVEATAGDGDGYHDDMSRSIDAETEPVGRAYRAAEPVVAHGFDADADDPWVAAAAERGFSSLVALPIRYGAATHAVLGVFSDRADVFDEAERALLTELCSGIAYAVNALSLREAISADRVVELGFALPRDHPFAALTAASEGTIDLRTFVPTDEGGLWYGVAEGVDREALTDVADDTIERVRVVGGGDDGTVIEVVVAEAPLRTALAGIGGRLSRLRFADGDTLLTVAAPITAETGVVEELVVDQFPDAELRSQRHVDRGPPPSFDAAAAVDDRLTDRQRAVAEAAFYGGYFDATRKTTGAELAEQFGISKATFHEHLRAATRKIFDVVLGGPVEDPYQ